MLIKNYENKMRSQYIYILIDIILLQIIKYQLMIIKIKEILKF